jgi:hypothetical protein
MTPGAPAWPHTTLELLFGAAENAPESLAAILSGDVGGNLASALERLPREIRKTSIRKISEAAAGLLDVNLIGVLVSGWREHQDLTSAARRTLAVPGSTELVDLATHQVTEEQQPYVSVLVDGHDVATLQLGLSVVLEISALLAGISAGRLIAVHSGRCDITGKLTIQGRDAITRRAHSDLPGVITLSQGLRLLPAQDYPSVTEQADRAKNGSAQANGPTCAHG